jgi:hypothetical protein
MFTNLSELSSKSASSNLSLVRWRCFKEEEDVLSPHDVGFVANVYLVSLVNVLGVILALLLNPLVIYGVYKNKQINKITRTLTILMALAGLFGSLVIQSLFVTSKLTTLATIYSQEESNYCTFIFIVAYGTKVVGAFSIILMLGITTERLVAVAYPFQYRTTRTVLMKTLPCAFIALFIHFTLSDIWPWYQNFAKIVTAIFIYIPYVFIIFTYRKIHFKLRKWSGTQTAGTKRSITSILVVVTYLICFFPLIIIRSFNLDKNSLLVKLYVRPWCNTLLFCSFSLNAVVYGWSSIRRFIPIMNRRS